MVRHCVPVVQEPLPCPPLPRRLQHEASSRTRQSGPNVRPSSAMSSVRAGKRPLGSEGFQWQWSFFECRAAKGLRQGRLVARCESHAVRRPGRGRAALGREPRRIAADLLLDMAILGLLASRPSVVGLALRASFCAFLAAIAPRGFPSHS